MKSLIVILALVFSIGIASALPFAAAQSLGVPDWVKNTAMWWAEGKITEQEFLNAVEFLVENKVINIESSSIIDLDDGEIFPSTKIIQVIEKFKANKPPLQPTSLSSDGSYLSAMKVKIGGGDLTEELTLDTMARYNSGKDNTALLELRKAGFASYFVLESLPSKDKADLYKLISKYINPGKSPQPFDVSISGIMSDGTTILTTYYKKCQADQYTIYTQDLTINYQYTNEKQDEIRDKIRFLCGGEAIGQIVSTFPEIDFTIDENQDDNSTKTNTAENYLVPHENDRAASYVVHFFDGELEEMRSFDTFKVFSITNPLASSPQFYLESLPTKDKKGFYEFLARYINPGSIPRQFNVSVDLISGDGTILQRWNYVKCDVIDYTMEREDYIFRYAWSGEEISELIEKTDFKCNGLNLKVHGHDSIDQFPTPTSNRQKVHYASYLGDNSLEQDNRAMSISIESFGGDLEDTRVDTNFQKFESLSWKRPNIPANHPKPYEFGFYIESNPSKDKAELYEFFSKYINAGKPPEPFYANVNVITGDGTILHTLKFTKCSALDFDWYYQEYIFFYTLTEVPSPETRERYTLYCEGLTIEVP